MIKLFEICPRCCHVYQLPIERLKPMVLSGDNKKMQCGVCNHEFVLPDCEVIKETARRQREIIHGGTIR